VAVVKSAATINDISDVVRNALGETSMTLAPEKGSMSRATGVEMEPASKIRVYGVWAADATNARAYATARIDVISDRILMVRTM
jgi:hypothetical protein